MDRTFSQETAVKGPACASCGKHALGTGDAMGAVNMKRHLQRCQSKGGLAYRHHCVALQVDGCVSYGCIRRILEHLLHMPTRAHKESRGVWHLPSGGS
jgi:hypothetical protein